MSDTELAQLRRWKAEAMPVLSGLQELGRALGLRPGESITGETARKAAEALVARAGGTSSVGFEYELDKVPHGVDGDTFDAVVSKDVGFHMTAQFGLRVRLLYVDTYEVHKGTAEDRAKGLQATMFTEEWLAAHAGYIHVRTVDMDSFSRWLSEVYAYYPSTDQTVVLADELVAAGFQKPDSKYGPKQ